MRRLSCSVIHQFSWLLLSITITIQAQAAPVELGEDVSFRLLTDRHNSMGLDEVAELPDSAFKPPSSSSLHDSLPPGSHWLLLDLTPEQLVGGGWFEIVPTNLSHMTIYMRSSPSEPWREQSYEPTDSSTARSPLMLPLTVLDDRGLELLIHLVTPTGMPFEARIWSVADYARQIMRGTALWSFYFGVALLSTLLALALAYVLRSRTLLAIAAYGFTHVFSGFQVILGWGLFPGLLPVSGLVMSGTMVLSDVAMLWLAREALDIRLYFPRIDKAILALIGVLLLSIVLLPFWTGVPLVMVTYVMAGLVKCLLAALGFVLWYQHGWKYGLMSMAYALLIVASVTTFLSSFGWIPFAPFNFLAWQYFTIGLVLMICCLLVHGVLRHQQDMLAARSLKTQLDIEREAGFRQRQFVGMVSHEFRTPLSVITAAARNLQRRIAQEETPRDEDARLRLSRILKATGRLVQLTDNCLADARLDRQLDSVEMVRVDLLQVLKEAAELVEFSDRHQLRLVYEGEPVEGEGAGESLPASPIQGDAALLRIAFSNVLDNAVKYSVPGLITVEIGRQQQWWRVAVENRGQGIQGDMAKTVFQPYVTGCPEQCPKSGSTGLGLAVAEKITRAHRGVLKLESGDPERTVFAFFFAEDEQDG